MPIQLYVSPACPFCEAAREHLEWRGVEFVEYNVEEDAEALARLISVTGGTRTVPVIVEDGKPVQVGWQGRGCAV